jgi:hypothetical protein
MKLVNLTTHAVNIYNETEQEVLVVKPSGQEARIKTETLKTEEVDGIPLFNTIITGLPYLTGKDGESDLPPQEDGTIYIVSGIFRSNFDRPDLYQPGRLLRDSDGNPTGCVGLSR